jgi:hypothetical protein
MSSREAHLKTWESFWRLVDNFSSAVSRYKARNVNAAGLRQQARDLVQAYFREARLALLGLGVTDATTKKLNAEMLRLNGLSLGNNSKTSYQNVIRNIKANRKEIESGLEYLIGIETQPAMARSASEGSRLFQYAMSLGHCGESVGAVLLTPLGATPMLEGIPFSVDSTRIRVLRRGTPAPLCQQ